MTETTRVRKLVNKQVTPASAAQLAKDMIARAPAQQMAARHIASIPELGAPFTRIVERVFTLADPEGEYKLLEERLSIAEALTPGVLCAAANVAEDYARRAHRLYVVAAADYERFSVECDAVMEGMREAATTELQQEKTKGERNKAITDADVRGRAAVMFPDEWRRVNERRIKAERMLDHLKRFADLWQSRCFGVGKMLDAGKRS